jgi:hypothetical protein
MRRFTNSSELLKLKCLLLPIQSHKDLEKEMDQLPTEWVKLSWKND